MVVAVNHPVCWRGRGGALLRLAPSPHPSWVTGMGCAQLRVSPHPLTPTGHGRFCCEPRAWPKQSCLCPPWRRQRAGNTHLGTLGCSPPVMGRACMASPNSINTQHPSGMCPRLSPTSTHTTVGHSWRLCWRMSVAWVMPQLPWRLLWERRDVHSLRSRVQEAFGTPKATLGSPPSIAGPADGSSIFPPMFLPTPVLSPDRGLSPWQWEVTSGCGGQSDMMQETRWCLSVS